MLIKKLKVEDFIDITRVILVGINFEQKVFFINKNGCEILGYEEKEIIGKDWFENFIPLRIREKAKKVFQSLMNGKIEKFDYLENPVLTRSKEEKIISWKNTVLRDSSGRIIGTLISGIDVTEQKSVEEKLKKLISRLQNVREEERTVIARDIHDHLGQNLTALKMDLYWLEKKLPKNFKILREKIKSMKELIDSSFKIIREISTRLRPSVLDDLGLFEAIKWQTEEFQNRTGIKCFLSLSCENIEFDKNRALAIFRIFQEILRNIAHHAQASEVKIDIKRKNNNLILNVKDNGIGIPKEKINDSKSLGIIGMQERVDFLEGEIEIKGIKGKGTTVRISVPIK